MRWFCVPAALALAGALTTLASQASSAILITVDKAAQQMTVVVDGELRWTWPVSTGLTKYDTPNGSYTTFRMERKHFSREWDDAPMPHSIFFTQNGHAIHGSYAIRRLGSAASHGCVRLAPRNAAQLFALVRKHGLANTQVMVQGALPGSVPMPIIAVPLPRERSTALKMVAKLEAPAAVQDDASAAAESKPADTAAIALTGPDRPAEELTASARVAAQPRERRATLPAAAELDRPADTQRDASTPAESKHGDAIIVLRPDQPGEEHTASAHIGPQPDERRAVSPAVTESAAPVVISRDRSTVLESKPDTAAITALEPERPAEAQTAAAHIVAQPIERGAELHALVEPAMPAALSVTPTAADADPGETAAAARSPEAPAVEQREATRTLDEPPRRQAARALPRPHALPEPPRHRPQRAERNRPPRYAGRFYDDPPAYRRSWSTDRPPIFQRRSPRFAPDIYYDPHVEIIEEVYINGQWVRHRYYRRARPRDFYRYR
jgi:hypothetical protein